MHLKASKFLILIPLLFLCKDSIIWTNILEIEEVSELFLYKLTYQVSRHCITWWFYNIGDCKAQKISQKDFFHFDEQLK